MRIDADQEPGSHANRVISRRGFLGGSLLAFATGCGITPRVDELKQSLHHNDPGRYKREEVREALNAAIHDTAIELREVRKHFHMTDAFRLIKHGIALEITPPCENTQGLITLTAPGDTNKLKKEFSLPATTRMLKAACALSALDREAHIETSEGNSLDYRQLANQLLLEYQNAGQPDLLLQMAGEIAEIITARVLQWGIFNAREYAEESAKNYTLGMRHIAQSATQDFLLKTDLGTITLTGRIKDTTPAATQPQQGAGIASTASPSHGR